MKIEEFLERLEGVQKSGSGWVACCPSHGDDHPSMSVKEANGKILLHCHAGCTFDQIVSSMGLTTKDMFADGGDAADVPRAPEKKRGKNPPAAKVKKPVDFGKLVKSYLYKNAEGAILYRVDRRVRADGRKTFVQMHPNPPGSEREWGFGLTDAGVERVPYLLPQVVAAAKRGGSIVVCEGEKDVESIVSRLGITATCNSGGAMKWLKGFGKYFQGAKQVLIIADKDPLEKIDEKTGKMKAFAVGQRHACLVEKYLREDGFTGSIKKIVMPDVVVGGCGEAVRCKDFTDWVEAMDDAGQTVDRAAFAAVIKRFGEWPGEWDFKDVAGEVEVATASVADEDGEEKGSARYGVPVRAPDRKARTYKVDFRIGGSFTVEIQMNWLEILNVRSQTDKNGKRHYSSRWELATLPMMQFWAEHMVADRMGKDAKLTSKMKSELQSIICLLWLRSRGKFFWDAASKRFDSSLYFDETTGVLMRIQSDEFLAFVATESEINRESNGFKFLKSLINDAALNKYVSEGVRPSNLYDRRGDIVYVSNDDDKMYRIAEGKIDLVQNGTDGVVFMRGKTLAPWKLLDGPGVDPFLHSELFKSANFENSFGSINIKLWTLNLFFSHRTKPLLLIYGPAQSGKTRLAIAIKEILGVRQQDGEIDRSVIQPGQGDKGEEAYWIALNNGKLEVFDNVDGKPPAWVSSAFQTASTAGQKKMRTLYTTGDVTILYANANQILTANDPKFITEGRGGMADRTIGVPLLEREDRESADVAFSVDFETNRNAYLTFIVRTVAAAMNDHAPVEKSINKRHPEYGEFSVRCGRAMGCESLVIEALTGAEANKAIMPLQENYITRQIIELLRVNNWRMRLKSKEASAAIVEMLGSDADDESPERYSSRRIGTAISNNMRQLRKLFKIDGPKKINGDNTWDFDGLTIDGEIALRSRKGGKVDSGDSSGKSPVGNGNTQGYGISDASNPPNPPNTGECTRARGYSPLSHEKEENENIEGINEEIGDDWSFEA